MAIETVYTAARMFAIEQASIVAGIINSAGKLILTTKGGTDIDAGRVVDVGTAAPTPSTIVSRDAAARAQFADPAVAADADTMGARDAAIAAETANIVTIGAGTNLNDYVVTGKWAQTGDANAAGGTNYPVGSAGLLEVNRQSSSFIYQRYTTYRGANRAFFRNYYGSIWGPWTEVADRSYVDAKTWDASDLVSGTLADARIPNLNASKITAGTITDARLPEALAPLVAYSRNMATLATGFPLGVSTTFMAPHASAPVPSHYGAVTTFRPYSGASVIQYWSSYQEGIHGDDDVWFRRVIYPGTAWSSWQRLSDTSARTCRVTKTSAQNSGGTAGAMQAIIWTAADQTSAMWTTGSGVYPDKIGRWKVQLRIRGSASTAAMFCQVRMNGVDNSPSEGLAMNSSAGPYPNAEDVFNVTTINGTYFQGLFASLTTNHGLVLPNCSMTAVYLGP